MSEGDGFPAFFLGAVLGLVIAALAVRALAVWDLQIHKDRIMALCAEKQIYQECQKAWEGE